MDDVLNLYKPIGLTPLQLLNQIRSVDHHYQHSKLTYVGRLDPMAHGVILVLADQAISNTKIYKSLSKTYQVNAILGVQTDTYDTLGIVNHMVNYIPDFPNLTELTDWLRSQLGWHNQDYPPYSSAKVNGRALFEWARMGKLKTINIPSHPINIFQITNVSVEPVFLTNIIDKILSRISLVQGDFRQSAIIDSWKHLQIEANQIMTLRLSCKISCSSGTYIRSIIHEMGEYFGCGAIVYDLLRTQVGNYTLNNSRRLDESSPKSNYISNQSTD